MEWEVERSRVYLDEWRVEEEQPVRYVETWHARAASPQEAVRAVRDGKASLLRVEEDGGVDVTDLGEDVIRVRSVKRGEDDAVTA